MKTFAGNRFGRYVIIGLQKDDLILESVQKAVEEYGIQNAIVTSGIAATYHMRWHHISGTGNEPAADILETSGPIEVSGIGGLVINRIPHLHCTFADHGRTWAGHMKEGCRVQYVGEISMIELLDLDIERIPDQYGVELISEKPAESAD